MLPFFNEKIQLYRSVLDNIYKNININKNNNVVTQNDYNNCIENIEKIINLINTINNENILNDLQYINNSLSSLIKNYGVYSFEYLLQICIGSDYNSKILTNNDYINKYELIKKYLHPISYKVINWTNKLYNNNCKKEIIKNKIIDEKVYVEDSDIFECYDLARSVNNFKLRVEGIKVVIHDSKNKRTLIIDCLCDLLLINNIEYNYIKNSIQNINNHIQENNLQNNEIFVNESWCNFKNMLSLKEYLIYNSKDIFNKYVFIMNQINSISHKTINSLVQEFIGSDIYGQRNFIIYLLLNNYNQEYQYISYLLYDLLSNENTNGDSDEQKILYDSLPYNCKKIFKDAMYKTIEYTSMLSNFDNNKIPLEQQICLMKVKDNVKEKAMQKLKEIKSKSEDSGSKARQYLDGLLKIPFNIYKEEYILSKKNEISDLFKTLKEPIDKLEVDKIECTNLKDFFILLKDLLKNNSYNSLEILNIVNTIDFNLLPIYNNIFNYLIKNVNNKKKVLLHIVDSINLICKKKNLKVIKHGTNINAIKLSITDFLETNKDNLDLLKEILVLIESVNSNSIYNYFINLEKNIHKIKYKNTEIVEYISNFNNILDNAVHGHKNAKKQIERILGQWINGEKSGYCFGFEGPPGIGKTSMAKKGLANCLKDKDGESRPFSFIALGGSSNGSILDGHNYTYVGSTWGKIVDILIENKCMNPIIFIDELDKVSKTENGKEIIGILTHLIDSTQNDGFQDKYFSNIDLDLSKALFIFSYNDPDLIDKILLDRIHRIKFENLLLDDKLIISRDYLLPELYNKFGLENILTIDTELIKYIIENYTMEPGVRKLKEIYFEIISSINLELLKQTNKYSIPLIVTKEIVDDILKERNNIKYMKINNISKVGIVNGMWANAYGNSGILHIECKYFYSSTFLDFKLTGMQGDVMKESMMVSKTLALSLIKDTQLKQIIKELEENKMQGIHIHVPEGATPKDGPSAGAAITLVIYSLLTKKKIRNNFAITGEICLQGNVTCIGALDLKILGGIRAGVTSFLYPKDNAKDFKIFYDKHQDKLNNYNFYEVENINDVIKYMII